MGWAIDGTRPPRGATVIYGLHDGDGKTRYVGRTTRFTARLSEHVCHSRDDEHQGNAALATWIRGCSTLHAVVLEVVADGDDAPTREAVHIAALPGLLNVSPGYSLLAEGCKGLGGRVLRAATRAKRAASMRLVRAQRGAAWSKAS
jgi:predicted GIY-YIG superfamily endonuclease